MISLSQGKRIQIPGRLGTPETKNVTQKNNFKPTEPVRIHECRPRPDTVDRVDKLGSDPDLGEEIKYTGICNSKSDPLSFFQSPL
ncbi:MAG: hypothetical protein PVH55_08695 [Desulfobacterales bacterium]